MNRQERRRERLISLTQTEIMFVLASAILILLLAKSDELFKTQKDLQEARSENVSMSVSAKENAGAGIIHKIITESGIDPAAPDVVKQVSATLDAMIAERPKREIIERELRAVDAILEGDERQDFLSEKSQATPIASKSKTSKHESRAEKLRKVMENAAVGKAAQKSLGTDSESPQEIEDRIAELKEEAEKDSKERSGDKEKKIPPAERLSGGAGKSKGIVFVPCWPRKENPRHYFAYDIAYDGKRNLYKISPHENMQNPAAVVRSAISGKLKILQDYPQGWITGKILRDFGKKVQKAKNAMYPNNTDCRLSVFLDDNHNRPQSKLIVRSGFFPVWRY